MLKTQNTVKKHRKKLGLTQQQLADQVNISMNHISRLENQRHLPRIDVIIKLCNFFKIDQTELFELKEEKSQ